MLTELSGPHGPEDAHAAAGCRELVLRILSEPPTLFRDDWWRPSELQRLVREQTGQLYSESSITARLRDLRKLRYGGHLIDVRTSPRMVRDGHGQRQSREREYRLIR